MAGWQNYVSPGEAYRGNSFAAAPAGIGGQGFDYGASARAMTGQNFLRAQIPGGNLNYAQPGEITAPQAQSGGGQGSWLDRLYDDYAKAHQDAFAANEKGFGITAGFLGVDANGNPLPTQPESWADAYSRDQEARRERENMPVAPVFSGKSPSMGKINADAVGRGIFNNSFALNNAHLGSAMDQFSADQQTFNAQVTLRNQEMDRRERDLGRAERLRDARVDLFSSPRHQYPDPGMLAQLASQYGAGTTEGLSPAAFGGGGGGGGAVIGGSGYGLPFAPGVMTAAARRPDERSMGPVQGPEFLNAAGIKNREAQKKLREFRGSHEATRAALRSVGDAEYLALMARGVKAGPRS